MDLRHWDTNTDGPLSEAAITGKLQALGYFVTCYTYPPGVYFPPHSHSVDKIDAVLTGQFRMEMEGQSVILKPGDYLIVPRGVLHSAEVVGNESVVSLDAIKQP